MVAGSSPARLRGPTVQPLEGTVSRAELWSSRSIFWAPASALARYPGVVKTFDDLFLELQALSTQQPEGSGTVALLDKGVHAIGKKIVEEASEVWMAAEHESSEALAIEISQLIYHLQVLMLAKGLTTEDVYREL